MSCAADRTAVSEHSDSHDRVLPRLDRADGRFQCVVLLEVLCLLDSRTLSGFLPRFSFKMCVRFTQQVNVHYIICSSFVVNQYGIRPNLRLCAKIPN